MKKILTIYLLFLFSLTQLFGIDFSVKPKKLSAYYIAKKQNLAIVKRNLLHQSFEILATTTIFPGYTVITISNEELKQTNSYMATLQINVNPYEIRIQNPSYLGAAYLGKKYYYGKFSKTTTSLEKVFGILNLDQQQLSLEELYDYKFMYGLPTKKDILRIKISPSLGKSISLSTAKQYIAYQMKLPNGSILVGHRLHPNTNSFLDTLNQKRNAQILPYESMINGHEVSIMNPKYYLALSLPTLTLTEFMQIASTPDRIFRNIKKVYDSL